MTEYDRRKDRRLRAEEFLARHRASLCRFLGFGNDGDVWETSRNTAVKVYDRDESFDRELACYLRLRERDVSELDGFAEPQLIGSDPTRLAIEMTIVCPPYVIDFAKSYVDTRPDYSPEALDEWEQDARERFDDHWPVVRKLLTSLRFLGIHYFDAKPDNIRFLET